MIEDTEEEPLGETLSTLFATEKNLGPPAGWVHAPWIGEEVYVNPAGQGLYGLADSVLDSRQRDRSPQAAARRAAVIEAEMALSEAQYLALLWLGREQMLDRARAWERTTGLRVLSEIWRRPSERRAEWRDTVAQIQSPILRPRVEALLSNEERL